VNPGRRADPAAGAEADGARLFDREAAVLTLSASVALYALGNVLSAPGATVLVPSWLCSGALNAVHLAGLVPRLLDVADDFSVAPPAADGDDVALAVYAPFGGNPTHLAAWQAWHRRTGRPLLVDLAQSPDCELWRGAAHGSVLSLTSFREGKPLSGVGGGLLAGPRDVVDEVRTFLRGGKSSSGRKLRAGIDLPVPEPVARTAARRLSEAPGRVGRWREATGRVLSVSRDGVLPGWTHEGGFALSKLPVRLPHGRPMHPDPNFALPWLPTTAPDNMRQVYGLVGTVKVPGP
jgi:dTDP-4-amino-4,6-dideoxygalactose transaminase